MENLVVPVLTALISVGGALVSVTFGRRAARNDRLDAAEQIATRFREPLLQAVFNLQTRLFNIVELKFFERFYGPDAASDEQEYAELNTLYVIAQYFCWLEILRRDSQFVDPRDDARNSNVIRSLETVRDTFTDSFTITERCFRLFRGEQRALGEVLIVPVPDPQPNAPSWTCMGYAPFVRALDEDPQMARWFRRLRQDIAALRGDLADHDSRIRLIQRSLMDVIDIVDPDAHRVPMHLRKRLDPPATGPAVRTIDSNNDAVSARSHRDA